MFLSTYDKVNRRVARGGGAVPPPKCQQKRGEREKKRENKVACIHVKLPPFNHFQSKIKYKFVLYVENTGHMHQIAPLTTSKCKKLSLWEGPPPTPPPPPRSLRSLGLRRFAPSHVIFTAPPKMKSWLRHWVKRIMHSGVFTFYQRVCSVVKMLWNTVQVQGPGNDLSTGSAGKPKKIKEKYMVRHWKWCAAGVLVVSWHAINKKGPHFHVGCCSQLTCKK